MNLVDRIKKMFVPFFVGAALIAGCNTQQNTVPVCNPTIEENLAVQYAKEIGFTDLESEMFTPLGLDCEIGTEYDDGTEYDKVLIKLLYELKEKNEITITGIEGIIDRFGKEDKTGEDYTISRAEWSAINYALEQYELYLQDGTLNVEKTKFKETMIKALIYPEEYSIKKRLLNIENRGVASFPEILYNSSQNFMGITNILDPESDELCKRLFEAENQGYDNIYTTYYSDPSLRPLFANNTFYKVIVYSVVNEGPAYDSEGSYSVNKEFSENVDSSLIPYDLKIGVAHMYKEETETKNLPPEVGEEFDPWIYKKDRTLVLPNKSLKMVLIHPNYDGGRNTNFDYNLFSKENTLGYNIPKTEYHIIEALVPKAFHPQNYPPIGFMGHETRNFSIPITDTTGKIVQYDITNYTSAGKNVDPNGLDAAKCIYNVTP